MSAGYIQLAAIGQQNAYLTGEPQVTYFSGVYKRHTPFVLEGFDIPFLEQQVLYGTNNICRIPPKGDLVRALTLKLTLPALQATGQDFYWPIPPSISNAATVIFNGNYNYPNVAPYVGIEYYSTFNITNWLPSGPGAKITYDVASNKFTFKNVSNVYVLPYNNGSTNYGTFWGLDPRNPTSTSNGYLIYDVNVSRPADFTLEQAGWNRNPLGGMPDPPTRTGIFLQLNQNYTIPDNHYIDFASTSSTGARWTIQDQTDDFNVTTGGRINFKKTGLYAMKVGIDMLGGSVSNVAIGSSTTEDGAPPAPSFSHNYPWRVSPDPSTVTVLPIIVTSTSANTYTYIEASGATLAANSFVSVNLIDDVYSINNGSGGISVQSNVVPFYSNILNTGSAFTTLVDDGSFTFKVKTVGIHLMTGVISMSSGYVSKAQLVEGSNLIYEYDMSSQGRDPTFAFTMPFIGDDVEKNYKMNLYYTGSSTILNNSYVIFNQIGKLGTNSPGVVLPFQGLLFQSNVNSLSSPLNFNSNFTSNGTPYTIKVDSSGNFKFTNVGTYMMTSVLSTADQVTSISFGSTSYPVGLGLKPPYTFQIPLHVTDLTQSYNVAVTVDGSTTAPNIFSSSFVAIYPVTNNVALTTNFLYYDSVGTLAIKSAELKIGGQSIQTLTGEYIEIWNDINIPYENQPGLKLMTGKGDTSRITTNRTYFVNLPFYFYGHPELAIPITSLGRQDLEVHITLRNFSELTTAQIANPTLGATIITEYVYLSDPEINWFKQNRFDYVITQCQYQAINLGANFNAGVFNLDLKNPIKELFFVIQPIGNVPYDYTNNLLKSMGLSFNGYDAFTSTTTDALYLGTLEPFNHHVNFPTRKFYMYSFSRDPSSGKPTGAVNFSRIKQVLLSVNTDGYFQERQLRIAATSYNVLRIENGMAGLMFNT